MPDLEHDAVGDQPHAPQANALILQGRAHVGVRRQKVDLLDEQPARLDVETRELLSSARKRRC